MVPSGHRAVSNSSIAGMIGTRVYKGAGAKCRMSPGSLSCLGVNCFLPVLYLPPGQDSTTKGLDPQGCCVGLVFRVGAGEESCLGSHQPPGLGMWLLLGVPTVYTHLQHCLLSRPIFFGNLIMCTNESAGKFFPGCGFGLLICMKTKRAKTCTEGPICWERTKVRG